MDRDHDVPVGGLVAAVDDRVGHPLVEDEHRALARMHRHRHVDEGGDLAGPCACARDHEARGDARQASRSLVVQRRRHDPVAVALHSHEPLVRPCVAPVDAGVGEVGFDELPGLHGAVRQPEDAADARVEGGLASERLGDRDLLAVDVGRDAGGREALDVVVGVVRRCDEEPAGVLDAGRCDATEDPVLGDALAGGERVLGDVTAA